MATKKNLLTDFIETAEMPILHNRGQIIEGTVISSDDIEMLLDVGSRAEGVVFGGELKLDGKKVVKKVGEKILVYVVNPENKEGRVELSIRKTGDAIKWHELKEAKEKDSAIKVKVIEANTGGVIVEIGGGLRGFVPSSQLDNKRIYGDVYVTSGSKEDAAKRILTKLAELIDQELEVKVMEINENENKVILSEKMVSSEEAMEQRTKTLKSLKVGDNLTGTVTAVAPFGLFVNASGLEGLVHLSEISWDKVTNPADFYKVEDEVEVQVIGINDGGKRIAYSIKRLQKDPWQQIVGNYKVGQIVKGKISSIADYGAFVRIEDGLNGLIHISELSDKLVKNPRNIVSEGDEVEVMIISISNEDRHLGLSLKRAKEGEGAEDVEEKEDESSSPAETVEDQVDADAKKEDKEKADEKVEETTPAKEESSREMEGLDKLLEDEEK